MRETPIHRRAPDRSWLSHCAVVGSLAGSLITLACLDHGACLAWSGPLATHAAAEPLSMAQAPIEERVALLPGPEVK